LYDDVELGFVEAGSVVVHHPERAKWVLNGILTGVMNISVIVLMELLVVKMHQRNTCHHFVRDRKVNTVREAQAVRLVEQTDDGERGVGGVHTLVQVVLVEDVEKLEVCLH
jgi:hypothetical protein